MQIGLAAMLISAFDAALEDRKIAFDGVGVNIAASALLSRVLHGLVAGELTAHVLVSTAFIGKQVGLAVQVPAQTKGQPRRGRRFNEPPNQKTISA
jgi:hypothetical protein